MGKDFSDPGRKKRSNRLEPKPPPSLAESKKRKQERRLVVLLAGLHSADYSNDAGITKLKWDAQQFVTKGVCHPGCDAEISAFCKQVQKACRQVSKDQLENLSDASKNFYLTGQKAKNPVEALIKHLKDQKKKTQKQWREKQKRIQKRRLVVLLAGISETDYSNDSNISVFKAEAQKLVGYRSSHVDENGECTPEFDAKISGLCDWLYQQIKKRDALPDYVSNEALKAFYKAGQSEDPENALIKFLEAQEKKAQEQHLICLLANLKMEDYADNPQIRSFKQRAQEFIDEEGKLIPGTEDNVRVLLREIHSESIEKSRRTYSSHAITAFYFAGRQHNFVEALIEDLREHQAFSDQENFLLSLLSCLEVEDYPEDSPIRAFRDKALLVRNLGSRQEFDSLNEDIVSIHFMSSASSVSDNGIENHNSFVTAVKQTVDGKNYSPLIACLQQHQMLPRKPKVESSPAEMFESSSFSAAEGVDIPEGKQEESESEGDRSNSDEKDDEVIVEADTQLEVILSKEAQKQRHLIVLLARLDEARYLNKKGSVEEGIALFKRKAKELVDENGNFRSGVESEISELCFAIRMNIRFVNHVGIYAPFLKDDDPVKHFYKAGGNPDIQVFIGYLESQEQERQQRGFQLELHETQLKKNEAQLINLLANLKIEDYKNNLQIQIFKSRAKALVDEQGNLLPGTENDVYVLLKNISFISHKKSQFSNGCIATKFYVAGCAENFIEELIEHLKEHQEKIIHEFSEDETLPIKHGLPVDNTAELAREQENPELTRQCADALLAQPEMKELKKEVEHLRFLTEEACDLSIINRETADKVLHCVNVEAIECVRNMGRPAEEVIKGPVCDWTFLKEQEVTKNVSPGKKVVSRILMGVGIIVGVGLLVGLGLATGGVAPAVFAAVAAAVATVASPITLPFAIVGAAGIVGGFGICIRELRHTDICESKEGKFVSAITKSSSTFWSAARNHSNPVQQVTNSAGSPRSLDRTR